MTLLVTQHRRFINHFCKVAESTQTPRMANGLLKLDVWEELMLRWAKSVNLQEFDWKRLLHVIGPTRPDGLVDYDQVLTNFAAAVSWTPQKLTDVSQLLLRDKFSTVNELSAVFKWLDADGDGFLDRDEVRRGCKVLNTRLGSHEQINPDHLFEALDIDKDGKLDRYEFLDCFRSKYNV